MGRLGKTDLGTQIAAKLNSYWELDPNARMLVELTTIYSIKHRDLMVLHLTDAILADGPITFIVSSTMTSDVIDVGIKNGELVWKVTPE